MKRTGGPAFPLGSGDMRDPCGMTLRDWFAGKALVGELGSQSPEIGEWPNSQLKGLAERCYCIADAMLVERAKE